jgi:hypothetical protein
MNEELDKMMLELKKQNDEIARLSEAVDRYATSYSLLVENIGGQIENIDNLINKPYKNI